MKAEANILNLEIPGELAYVYNKLDGKWGELCPCITTFTVLMQGPRWPSGYGR